MPVNVVATGKVTGTPNRVSADNGLLAVFVFDPFPDSAPVGAAHACEVRCRDNRLIGEVLRRGVVGAPGSVRGELTMSVASGPAEDELCVVRVGIEAPDVDFGSVSERRA